MSETQNFYPHGAGAWVRLRLAAVALIPLTGWIIYSILELRGASYDDFTQWLKNPYNMAMLVVFILLSFYHGAMGTQEVIEDYIHCEKTRKASIVSLKLVAFLAALVSILSIVKVAF